MPVYGTVSNIPGVGVPYDFQVMIWDGNYEYMASLAPMSSMFQCEIVYETTFGSTYFAGFCKGVVNDENRGTLLNLTKSPFHMVDVWYGPPGSGSTRFQVMCNVRVHMDALRYHVSFHYTGTDTFMVGAC